MAPPGKDRGRGKPSDAKTRVRRGRPKVCQFCTEHTEWVDYKDTNVLRRFITDRGKIKARTNTGACAQHQRDVALAIKTARELAMLPYVVRTLAGDKAGGRRGRPTGRPAPRGAEADTAAAPDATPVDDGPPSDGGGDATLEAEAALTAATDT